MKYVLIVIISTVTLFLVIGLFTSKNFTVEKEIEIALNETPVFDYLKRLKNQDEYSVWSSMDSNMVKEYIGKDATVGFISKWESSIKEVGKGEQEIISISEKSKNSKNKIVLEIRFLEPFQSKYKAFLSTDSVAINKTKVTWGFKGSMEYPSNLFLLFIDMEHVLGPDLQQGLSNLKQELE